MYHVLHGLEQHGVTKTHLLIGLFAGASFDVVGDITNLIGGIIAGIVTVAVAWITTRQVSTRQLNKIEQNKTNITNTDQSDLTEVELRELVRFQREEICELKAALEESRQDVKDLLHTLGK